MPSLKSHLFALVLKHTRRKAFQSPEGLHAWIARSRKTQDHRPPVKVAQRIDIHIRQVEGHPIYEAKPKSGTVRQRILYLHGGAYCFEMTSFHWKLIAEMVATIRKMRIEIAQARPYCRFTPPSAIL